MKKFFALLIIAVLLIGISDLQAKKKQEMAIGGELGLAVPMGNFGDAANIGFGANFLFNYQINKEMSILGSIGYFKWGSKALNDFYDYSYSNVPLAGAFHYYFVGDGSLTPFIGGELSMNFFSWSVEAKSSVFGTSYSTSYSETRIGLAPFAGILMPLSPQIDFRATAKFHVISDLNYFSLSAGILYKLD
jgi:hypothetical protein